MTEEHWHDEHARCLGVLLDGRAQPTGILRSGEDATLLLILNAYHDAVSFRLPEVAEGSGWTCLLDTQRPEDRSANATRSPASSWSAAAVSCCSSYNRRAPERKDERRGKKLNRPRHLQSEPVGAARGARTSTLHRRTA